MVDGTTDGIVTTGEIQREELWFDKLDLTATVPSGAVSRVAPTAMNTPGRYL